MTLSLLAIIESNVTDTHNGRSFLIVRIFYQNQIKSEYE